MARVLETRKEADVPFEEFPLYQQYLSQTMNDPDEIYELKDSEGDQYYSYIKTFEKNGESFYYISLCIKDLAVKESKNDGTVYPCCITSNK